MRPLFRWTIALGCLGLAGFWVLTRPTVTDPADLAGLTGDAARGEAVFWAGGCVSCHAPPGAEGEAKLVLAGGQRFASDFGTFVAPNISPDPDAGIGGWTAAEFVTAMQHGVSPEGAHYYPAFPYTAYRLADVQDMLDLQAFIATLPPSDAASLPHDLGFPFTIRRGLGLWKALYLHDDFAVSDVGDAQIARGRYLSEALAHCAECHTPRDLIGGLDRAAWMAGAPNPNGQGRIPPLSPDRLAWSAGDIAAYLRDGFTPSFDSAGGHMRDVITNLARLPEEDRAAIAAYIKALPLPEGAPEPEAPPQY